MPTTDWTDGYYVETEYTSGYYPYLAPEHLRFVCQASGLQCRLPEAPTYLELGCGRGVSVAIHAAATDGVFWGVDFNPAHISHAQTLADASGAAVTLSDEGFADFAKRDDLPAFDVIALHGVWSWISKANRTAILDLIRTRLKPGGLVYVSYNCLPGWATLSPVRQLLTLGREQRVVGAEHGADEVDRAIDFVQAVAAANPRAFAENPAAVTHVQRLGRKNRAYLAHEYLNDAFHAPYFTEVADDMGSAKLTYVGSARVLDRVNDLNLTADGLALLDRLEPLELSEAVRDFLVNQRFRSDVYVKGATRLSPAEQDRFWGSRRFMLVGAREELEFQVRGALGEATLPAEVYGPLADAFAAEDYRAKTLDEMIALSGLKTFRRIDAIAAISVLVGMKALRPAVTPSPEAAARSAAYNAHVLERAATGPHLQHLAAPAVGSGVVCPRPSQLFLRAWMGGGRDADALAAGAWEVFEATQVRAVKNGEEMVTREDNLRVLAEMAEPFLSRTIPLYRALGIVT